MNASILKSLVIAVLIALLGIGVYTDVRYGKIYNKLTLPCIAIGILLNTGMNGFQGLLGSIGGVLVVLIPFLLFAPMVGIGGGDIKLMMAVGSLLGFNSAIWAMLISAIAGGVLALIVMIRYNALISTTKNMARNIYLSTVGAKIGLSSGSRNIKFRYSPAIAFGTLATVFWQLLK